ncbi:hypothetical protein H2509_05125 [Stappia sp. F7233]|uniref:Uncharacterized protein n=1 Tax=Stappia albiluteola TaxID=2758565 RepID=A0A839AAA7_9HYPH|nr:hypothetical protein [Stappia albiluteola]MBA5776503.1 hypothetical protein [Stappia albiluteola]
MPISLAGLIGAAIGLYIGWLDYKILTGVLRAQVEKRKQKTGNGGFLERFEEPVRVLVMGLTVIGFPVIGYIAARQLAG